MFYNKPIEKWSLQEIAENFEDWIFQGCTERDKKEREEYMKDKYAPDLEELENEQEHEDKLRYQ